MYHITYFDRGPVYRTNTGALEMPLLDALRGLMRNGFIITEIVLDDNEADTINEAVKKLCPELETSVPVAGGFVVLRGYMVALLVKIALLTDPGY